MQQNNINGELLKKYILNECTPEEVRLVIKYFQNTTNSDDIPSVEDVILLLKVHGKLEGVTSDVTFDSVLEAAKDKERTTVLSKNSGNIWRRIGAAAAVFIGLLSLGYFFWQNQIGQNSMVIPEDAITLELEDGSIEILSEDGSKKVVDKKGNVLGQQNGGQISYEDASNTGELVYNTLTVPYGKRFELKLSDGTSVHLNSGTSLKYPVKFLHGQQRKVFLTGEAFFWVSKDVAHPFIVNADKLDVRVLGTQFNVSSYPEDDRSDVVLVEGSVGMYDKTEKFDKTKSTILEPGFKGTFKNGNGEIHTQPVLVDIYTSWIRGELVFRNMAFENILRKLERHFNVSITNKNESLAKEIFNASYGEVGLQKILDDLKLTYKIDYKINGTNITIN